MIAYEFPRQVVAPRSRAGSRAGRTAAEQRRERTAALRNRTLVRIVAGLFVATIGVVTYLALMANVTRLDYEISKAGREQTRLVEEGIRLDDQIARLESRDRLARIAAQLGMRDAQAFTVATLPAPPRTVPAPPAGLAFLTMQKWLR